MNRKRVLFSAAALTSAAALVLSGCSSSTADDSGSGGSDTLTVGTTDKITKLDPAGSYDNGSLAVMLQVFPFLVEYKPGTSDIVNGIAESAKFTKPDEFTVKLKSGLKWANGNDLTASDVKFSFDRQLKIKDANGPSSLLSSLDKTTTKGDDTVVFHLNTKNDQTFEQVLAGPAGPIVDEDSFSATKVTPDATIVKDKAFAGPYKIDSYKFNDSIAYSAFDGYKGALGAPKTKNIDAKYYSDANNMKLDIQQGNIDVAWRSLTPTDIEDLGKDDKLAVHKGPGGEIRYIVFNFDTMPYGAKAKNADPKKALAVRQAMADSIDRAAIAKDVYKDTFTPLYSYVPDGLKGANTALKSVYGDGKGGADTAKAKKALADAGVTTPVSLKLQYNPDHYGPSSGDEYAKVKQQLEATGLFKVDLQSTEYVQYSKDRVADAYPLYQLGWFPDYPDADNYLHPFFYNTSKTTSFLANHYQSDAINKALDKELVETNADARYKQIEGIQDSLAKDLPTLPLLQGNQVAITGKDVTGVDDTLDPSFQFRYGLLAKG